MITMKDPIAIANFRTKLEAETAATILANNGIPYLIQSQEGMMHGPMGVGATIFVTEADAKRARLVLFGEDEEDEPAF